MVAYPIGVTHIFIKFLVNLGNNIALNFGLSERLSYIFLRGLITPMVIDFIKVSNEDLTGDFSINRTTPCKI